MLARMYEPTLGRFSSRDVLFGNPVDPLSLNQLIYGAGNPVSFSDPTGLRPECGPSCSPQEEQAGIDAWSDTYVDHSEPPGLEPLGVGEVPAVTIPAIVATRFVSTVFEGVVGGGQMVDALASRYWRLLATGTRAERSAAAARLRHFGGSWFDNVLDSPAVRAGAKWGHA